MSVQRQGYVIYSYFKNSAFTAVKKGAKSQLQVGMWKVYMKRFFA